MRNLEARSVSRFMAVLVLASAAIGIACVILAVFYFPVYDDDIEDHIRLIDFLRTTLAISLPIFLLSSIAMALAVLIGWRHERRQAPTSSCNAPPHSN